MKYFCIENNALSSVLDYEPNVPTSVQVVKVSDKDYKLLEAKTHVFSIEEQRVVERSDESKADILAEEEKQNAVQFLNSTDWKVLRHIRQKALGTKTSLSEEEYIDLETQRASAAAKI